MSINLNDYSLESVDTLISIADSLRNLNASSALTIDDMITAMSEITAYKYINTTLPAATAVVITDYEEVTLLEKSKLTSLANAARGLCTTDFSSEKLQLSQIDTILKNLSAITATSYQFRAVAYCCDDASTSSHTVQCLDSNGAVVAEYTFPFSEGSSDIYWTISNNVTMHITNMYTHGWDDTSGNYQYVTLYEDVIEGTIDIRGDGDYSFRFNGDSGRSTTVTPGEIQPLHVSVCVEVAPFSDFAQIVSQFYVENMGTIPATGGTTANVEISDVSVTDMWIASDGNPYTEVCWEVVRYTVRIHDPQEGEEPIYIRPEMTVPGFGGSGNEAEWAIFSSDGTLMSTNDDGIIESQTTSITYTVTNEGDYGFEKNSSGYYVSQNGGIDNSYALCRVVFNVPKYSNIHIEAICSGESHYDYGIIGNIDQELSRSNEADLDYYFNFSEHELPYTDTIIFSNVSPGTYFVEIKYRKDGSVNNNDDCLSFKVLTGTDIGTGGGESGDPGSSKIYIAGYYGYIASGGSEIQLIWGDETPNSVVGSVTISGNDESFEISGANGERLSGHYKCIYTGYYSEYGNESCFNYYITGTLSSPLTQGTNYRIVVKNSSDYAFEDTYSLTLGDNMDYIPEPTYKGDLSESTTKTFSYAFGVDEGEGWADDGFYITIYENGNTYLTELVNGVGIYNFTNSGDQIEITRWEHVEQDIGWMATMLNIEGTISGQHDNLTKIVAHDDLNSPESGYYAELTVE